MILHHFLVFLFLTLNMLAGQVLFIIVLWCNYINKFYFILLNFTAKCIGYQIKTFKFIFCTAIDAKSTKVGQH